MGTHANPSDLEMLGFIPEGLGARLRTAGNTSLQGAQLLLLAPEMRKKLQSWSQQCVEVPLAHQTDFIEKYLKHMQFSYPD